MDTLHQRCCGLDVHKKSVVACVITPQGREIRTFRTMTGDLLALADWLEEREVTHAAMESTGVYWKPVYNILEDEFTVMVVNAAHIKTVPGRKTDVKDAEWIAELLQHGLLRASFIPDRSQRELRDLTRYRRSVVQERTREANRVQKILEGANIKLASVATNVLGASGRAMLAALAAGEEDPRVLADLAKGRLREKTGELEQALQGLMGPHQRFMLTIQLDHLNSLDRQIEDLDLEVARAGEPFRGDGGGGGHHPGDRTAHRRGHCGGSGHGHEPVSHPSTPGVVGRGVPGESAERGEAKIQSHPQRQQLVETSPGGSSQIRRTYQDLSGGPVPAPRPAHWGQPGGHGSGPLHHRHTAQCHQNRAALCRPRPTVL